MIRYTRAVGSDDPRPVMTPPEQQRAEQEAAALADRYNFPGGGAVRFGTELRREGNTWYVVETGSRWSEPTIYRSYFPVDTRRTTGVNADDAQAGLPLTEASWSGGYRVDFDRLAAAGWTGALWRFRDATVVVDPKAPPVRVETQPYPCPKVRKGIETRYYQGRWQKLLRKGWVDA